MKIVKAKRNNPLKFLKIEEKFKCGDFGDKRPTWGFCYWET